MPSPSRPSGAWAIAAASVLWGTTGTAAHAMPSDVSPLAIGAVTMGIGGVVLFLISAPAAIRVLRSRATRRWALAGAVGVVVYPLAFYPAMDLAGVAIGNVVALGSGPVFAALIEWATERARLSAVWIASTAVAVLGVALISLSGEPAPGSDLGTGLVLGLVAGLAYAWYTYCSGRALRSLGSLGNPPSSRAVMGAVFGVGAVVLVPVLLVTGGPILESPTAIGISAYLVTAPMAIAYLLFGYGLATARASTATTISLLEPLVATVLAVGIVGERLTAPGWVGIALILVGVSVLVTSRRGRPVVESP